MNKTGLSYVLNKMDFRTVQPSGELRLEGIHPSATAASLSVINSHQGVLLKAAQDSSHSLRGETGVRVS